MKFTKMQGCGNGNMGAGSIIMIEKNDSRYPVILRQIPDPPTQLYCI